MIHVLFIEGKIMHFILVIYQVVQERKDDSKVAYNLGGSWTSQSRTTVINHHIGCGSN